MTLTVSCTLHVALTNKSSKTCKRLCGSQCCGDGIPAWHCPRSPWNQCEIDGMRELQWQETVLGAIQTKLAWCGIVENQAKVAHVTTKNVKRWTLYMYMQNLPVAPHTLGVPWLHGSFKVKVSKNGFHYLLFHTKFTPPVGT